MESGSSLTSAGVIVPVMGGAGVINSGVAEAASAEAGDAAAVAVAVFFLQAVKTPKSRASDRNRFARRRTEIFPMVKLGGRNLCYPLAQVSAPAPAAKKKHYPTGGTGPTFRAYGIRITQITLRQ